MNTALPSTLANIDLASVFTEVTLDEQLGLNDDGSGLRLFHLQVRNNKFDYSGLENLLMNRLGEFVLSRAQIAQYKLEGNENSIVHRASRFLRQPENQELKEAALGNFMLHAFLELALGAPKLLSKVEIAEVSGTRKVLSDAVHLLDKSEGSRLRANLIFGASNVVGDFGDAVELALDRASAMAANEDAECKLVDQNILQQRFDTETIKYLSNLLLPTEANDASYDIGFGLFLAYDLGLDPMRYQRDEFTQIMENKLKLDLRAHIDQIRNEINRRRLGIYPFYIYTLPMNNAVSDRLTITEAVL
ncbi:HamA C-terminal domain-containing protein [Canibacter zhoujuaniae]|uniref:HamA C-terminal domain-containing protein n=1 Tax=Canibacter zhoujuaniae TaxID=2708343 RepID=UPI0014227108|nr:DUF1837 domain-containing protein [Canibacter zhoujuaniae]